MAVKFNDVRVRSKVWLQDIEGDPILGQGRIKILKAIEEHGSINAAAKSLGMSYRGAWDRLRVTEERLGQPLLEKTTGGKRGGGSRLTPFARDFLERFSKMQQIITDRADTAFLEIFPEFVSKINTSQE